jgi:hypothetical protein
MAVGWCVPDLFAMSEAPKATVGLSLDSDKMLAWLSRELEPMYVFLLPPVLIFQHSCEADPEVLAKYVLALLNQEANPHQDMKAHCVTELRDFLRDYTEDFVVSLFEAIESESTFSAPPHHPLGGSYKLPPGSAGDEIFADEVCLDCHLRSHPQEEEDGSGSMWDRRRRAAPQSDEEGEGDAEDSFKRRRSAIISF